MGLVNAFTEAVAGEDSGVDESTAFAFLSRFGFRSVDDFGYEETKVNFQKFVAEMERFDGHISLRAIFQVAYRFEVLLSANAHTQLLFLFLLRILPPSKGCSP